MDFTVIIPTYNRGYCINHAIDSVLLQEEADFELIIVDDGSIDSTREIVESYECLNIVYIKTHHSGPSEARNVGLKRSKGSVICFLDSDDVLYQGYFKAISAALVQQNAKYGCVNSDWIREFIDLNDNVISKHLVENSQDVKFEDIISWKAKVPFGTGLFLKREMLACNPIWKTDIKCLEELDFLIQLYRYCPTGFRYLPERLFRYRQRFGGDGICSETTYADLHYAFQRMSELYQEDIAVGHLAQEYSERASKYKALSIAEETGEHCPHRYKYFPELWISS